MCLNSQFWFVLSRLDKIIMDQPSSSHKDIIQSFQSAIRAACRYYFRAAFLTRRPFAGRRSVLSPRLFRLAIRFITFVVISTTGCISTSQSPMGVNRSDHVVTVDRKGRALHPDSFDEMTRAAFDTQLEHMIEAVQSSRKKKVLLFVHGGLNTLSARQKRVDEILETMLVKTPKDDASGDYYPLFLNWNSSLLNTAGEDLFFIRQGRSAEYLGPISAPVAAFVALGSGILRAPLVWGQLLASDMNTTDIEIFEFPGKRNSEALEKQLVTLHDEGHSAAIPIQIGDDKLQWHDKFFSAMRYVLTVPTKLASSPVIDGVGQGAWRNMLRRTQVLFHAEDEFDIRNYRNDECRVRQLLVQEGDPNCTDHDGQKAEIPKGAAYQLFSKLQAYMKKHEDTELTLVGHSMGAIVLNRALREFPDLASTNKVNVVYLAAACSIDDFRNSVIPYLQRNEQAHFYSLMLHPFAEVREWQANFLDLAPRGSLLVWIDNFLSAPHTILDRTLGRWENITQTAHIIPIKVRSRTTFKAFCVGEDCAKPTRHGDFSLPEYEFWSPDFWKIQ